MATRVGNLYFGSGLYYLFTAKASAALQCIFNSIYRIELFCNIFNQRWQIYVVCIADVRGSGPDIGKAEMALFLIYCHVRLSVEFVFSSIYVRRAGDVVDNSMIVVVNAYKKCSQFTDKIGAVYAVGGKHEQRKQVI